MVIVLTGIGVEVPEVVVAVDVKSVVPVVTPSNEVVVAATVVVSSTSSVISSLTGIIVSVIVSIAVSVVVSSTGVMAELSAVVVAVPDTLEVVELGTAVVLGPDTATVVTEPEVLIEVLCIFVVAGTRVVTARVDNEVAPVLAAPTPRVVEGDTIVSPVLMEVVAAAVMAETAGDVVPAFAEVIEAA